jgi:hypothetical protein
MSEGNDAEIVKDNDASNVVEFTPKREYVWAHTKGCNGGQEFWLHRDGSVQCCECKAYIPTLCWGHKEKG